MDINPIKKPIKILPASPIKIFASGLLKKRYARRTGVIIKEI
jgi:hypothetical protein